MKQPPMNRQDLQDMSTNILCGKRHYPLSKEEYEGILEYMERMRETIEVLSKKETVKKLNEALKRIEKGSICISNQFKIKFIQKD